MVVAPDLWVEFVERRRAEIVPYRVCAELVSEEFPVGDLSRLCTRRKGGSRGLQER